MEEDREQKLRNFDAVMAGAKMVGVEKTRFEYLLKCERDLERMRKASPEKNPGSEITAQIVDQILRIETVISVLLEAKVDMKEFRSLILIPCLRAVQANLYELTQKLGENMRQEQNEK